MTTEEINQLLEKDPTYQKLDPIGQFIYSMRVYHSSRESERASSSPRGEEQCGSDSLDCGLSEPESNAMLCSARAEETDPCDRSCPDTAIEIAVVPAAPTEPMPVTHPCLQQPDAALHNETTEHMTPSFAQAGPTIIAFQPGFWERLNRFVSDGLPFHRAGDYFSGSPLPPTPRPLLTRLFGIDEARAQTTSTPDSDRCRLAK